MSRRGKLNLPSGILLTVLVFTFCCLLQSVWFHMCGSCRQAMLRYSLRGKRIFSVNKFLSDLNNEAAPF